MPAMMRGDAYVRLWRDDWSIIGEPRVTVNSEPFVRFQAPVRNPRHLQFWVRQPTRYEKVADPVFVQSSTSKRVRAFFDDPELRRKLSLLEGMRLRLGRDTSLYADDLPDGVDLLWLEADGGTTEEEVRQVYEVFVALLPHLEDALQVPADPAQRALESLNLPEGVSSRWSGRSIWNAEERKERALDELARLRDPRTIPALDGVIKGGSPVLRCAAAFALGATGDASAVPLLIPLLGDYAPSRRGTVSAQATAALRALGFGAAAEAFATALCGDFNLLGNLEPVKAEATRAALEALRTGGTRRRIAAARLLAHWRVVGALPEIRALRTEVRRNGGRLLEALDAVIADMDTQRTLPRPSEAPPPSPAQLPIPAISPPPDPTGLPVANSGA